MRSSERQAQQSIRLPEFALQKMAVSSVEPPGGQRLGRSLALIGSSSDSVALWPILSRSSALIGRHPRL